MRECKCGWKGIPTFTGGTKTYKGFDLLIGSKVFKVEGAQPSCPVCKKCL